MYYNLLDQRNSYDYNSVKKHNNYYIIVIIICGQIYQREQIQ